jgi:hypothetical protein
MLITCGGFRLYVQSFVSLAGHRTSAAIFFFLGNLWLSLFLYEIMKLCSIALLDSISGVSMCGTLWLCQNLSCIKLLKLNKHNWVLLNHISVPFKQTACFNLTNSFRGYFYCMTVYCLGYIMYMVYEGWFYSSRLVVFLVGSILYGR